MKVLILIDILTSGGKERQFVELCKGLKEYPDIEFEAVTLSNRIQYPNFESLNIPIRLLGETKTPWSRLRTLFRLGQEVRRFRPDAVISWSVYASVMLWAASIGRKNFKIMEYTIQNSAVLSRMRLFKRLMYGLTFRNADYIAGNSQCGLDSYAPPKSKPQGVVYNGISLERFENLPPQEEVRKRLGITTRYAVGMVAGFWPKKDYKTFFEAAEMILSKRSDVSFVGIGDGNTLESFQKKYADLAGKKIFFTGRITDVEAVVNALDIGVLSSPPSTEGVANAIMEYMALGKAAVATRVGGTPELIVDGGTGLITESGNAVEMSEALEELLNDDAKRLRFGAAGRERIAQEFTVSRMVGKIVDILKNMVGTAEKRG